MEIKPIKLTPVITDGGFIFDGIKLITPTGEKIMYQDKGALKLYNHSFSKIRPYGNILFVGVGFGLLYNNWKDCDGVKSFTGVDISDEVIELNKRLGNNINYVCADAFEYNPQDKFNIIILDIFHDKPEGYIEKQKQLIDKYKKYLVDGGILEYLKIHYINI